MARLSREFIFAVKVSRDPAYRLAQGAGVNPNTLSKWMNGIEFVKLGDPRIVAIGAILGLPPERCFEAEPEAAGILA
jgi:hypothetical protein